MTNGPLDRALWPAHNDYDIRDVTVGDLLRDAAARWPDTIALIEGKADGSSGRRWTHAELLADCTRLAGALLTRFKPGERIAIWAPNAPEWVIIEYAAALAGLTLVTVNPGYVARELEYVLRQSRAAGLFLVAEHRGNPMAETAREVAADLPGAARGLRHRGRGRAVPRIGRAGRAARGRARRSGANPIYVGHHRLSQGRRAARTAAWSEQCAPLLRGASGSAEGAACLRMTPLVPHHRLLDGGARRGPARRPLVLLRQFDPDGRARHHRARAGRDVPRRADDADRDVRERSERGRAT